LVFETVTNKGHGGPSQNRKTKKPLPRGPL
jgi:hypothetical protein